MTRPSIGIIVTIAAIAAMVLFSCGKENPTPATPPLTDSCKECDKLKQLILTDPELAEGKNYLDSLLCKENLEGTYCSFNVSNPSMYGIFWKTGVKKMLINDPYDQLHNYKYIYYCLDATSDTPYMAPMFLAMDFNEARPNGQGIRCNFMEYSQYFDPTIVYKDGNGIERIGLYQYNKYESMPLYQVKDTLIMNKMDKKLSINGVIGTYWVEHNFVMSNDMETLALTAQVYDRSPGRSDAKLLKTITSYTLKRLKY